MCVQNGDLRKDARLMEFNTVVNRLLQKDTHGRRRKLQLRTYSVIILNEECGLCEWVPNTTAFRILVGECEREIVFVSCCCFEYVWACEPVFLLCSFCCV